MRCVSLLFALLATSTSLLAQSTTDTTKASHKSKKPLIFTSAVLGASAGTFIAKSLGHPIDSDPCKNGKHVCFVGTYKDGWTTKQMFSDKAWHGMASYAIADAGIDMGVTPWKASALTVVVGVLFEVQQGYISKHDIYADAIGAGAAYLKARILNRHK